MCSCIHWMTDYSHWMTTYNVESLQQSHPTSPIQINQSNGLLWFLAAHPHDTNVVLSAAAAAISGSNLWSRRDVAQLWPPLLVAHHDGGGDSGIQRWISQHLDRADDDDDCWSSWWMGVVGIPILALAEPGRCGRTLTTSRFTTSIRYVLLVTSTEHLHP